MSGTGNPFAVLTGDDFAAQMLALRPTGAAWPQDPDAAQWAYFAGLGDCVALVNAASANLSEVEADPAQTLLLLGDWETDYGLPDPCTPANPTLAQRHQLLLGRIAAIGGQSPAYYEGVAAAMGSTITIQTYQPFQAGVSHAGDPLLNDAWAYAWTVTMSGLQASYFSAGGSGAGDPTASYITPPASCLLQRLAPAHTVLIFNFT